MRIGPYGWAFPNSTYWKTKKSYRFTPKYFEGYSTPAYQLIVDRSMATNRKGSRITYDAFSEQSYNQGLDIVNASLTLPGQKNTVTLRNGRLWIADTGSMRFSSGLDSIEISFAGERALVVNGFLDLGAGDDRLEATGGEEGIHIYEGRLYAGDGNDHLTGINQAGGTYLEDAGIRLGYGALLDSGAGDDVITGLSEGGGYGYSLWSGSILQTGPGNDLITGGKVIFFSDASIMTGDGDDTIDVEAFLAEHTRNTIDMGIGTDRLRVAPGTYQVSSDSSGGYMFDLELRGRGWTGYLNARSVEMVSTDGFSWVPLQVGEFTIY
jgi:hypothetical protein